MKPYPPASFHRVTTPSHSPRASAIAPLRRELREEPVEKYLHGARLIAV
eukprot:gene11447-biopygen5931